MKKEAPLVSVICIAYNQEKYIGETLEGFVSQKTSFPYEIIVHDDASTDRTADIIREYAEKYPNIKPVFQTENQYSKGIRITRKLALENAEGKYLAFCEGDDCWTDSGKLEKQALFLENNPDYAACVHQTEFLDCRTGESRDFSRYDRDCDIRLYDVLHYWGAVFHTSALVMLKDWYNKKPEYCYSIDGVGDFPLAIYIAAEGKVRYFKDNMSEYRFCSGEISWSSRQEKQDEAVGVEKRLDPEIEMLELTDRYYGNRYHSLFHFAIAERKFIRSGSKWEKGFWKSEHAREVFKNMSFRNKASVIGRVYFSGIFNTLKRIKHHS